MKERPTEIVFMPGFDGVAELRDEFVRELGSIAPARSFGYPNTPFETLNGYARYAASQVSPDSRPVLVAESFSGLVAARWAAQDPHVAGIVFCGAFARSPMAWAALGASWPGMAQFFGANYMNPIAYLSGDAARRRWSQALSTAIASLKREVVAERLRIISVEDVTADLQALRIPMLIAQFQDDMLIGAEAHAVLATACADAAIVTVPGPHFAIETRPRETAAALRGAIEELFL
ncbi:MAG TPA: alpha/beta hydrolase [Usitatibacter sp.]|nr:alpha/beta hydrolase [Usitatibacter sp.]